MRMLAPLPAFLLLAASSSACPFGAPGHFHPAAGSAPSSIAMPEGKCTGRGKAPPSAPAAVATTPYDLNAHPVPPKDRPHWEMIGYRFDDSLKLILDPKGAVVTEAAMEALKKPFDASHERLSPALWSAFMLNGYRLDESTCRLNGPDAKPLDNIALKAWTEIDRRHKTHAALESLLVKLRDLKSGAPVPESIHKEMIVLANTGVELPPNVKSLLARGETSVRDLRELASASYAESTKFYDGQRPLADVARAAIPASEPGAAARRKGIPDPDERVLGQALRTAFNAQIAKTSPGRELLSHFHGPKGEDMPDLLVLKLTQNPNEYYAAAFYNFPNDQIVIDHWGIVRVLRSRLPPEKLAKIADRLADAKQLSKLIAEDPALLPIIVDDIDTTYFHELIHAAQSRRNRIDDELLRGNLPNVNPLSKEHEAHREHCRYLLSKSPAAIDRSSERGYCLDILRSPADFKDRITQNYLSTFSGSSTLDDVNARQNVRRRTSFSLGDPVGMMGWIDQARRLAFEQFGYDNGDAELAKYRTDVDKREKEFLADMPRLRREAGDALISHYEKTDVYNRALALALMLPPGTISGGEERLKTLTEKSIAWVIGSTDPTQRNERIAVFNAIGSRLNAERNWPEALIETHQNDVRSVAEEWLAKGNLDAATAWTKVLRNPGDLPARIEKSRIKKEK